MRPQRKRRYVAVFCFACLNLLMMTGCGASTATLAQSTTTSTASANQTSSATSSGSTSSTGAASASPTSLAFPDQGGSIAEIPATYVKGVPNRWVLYLHGYAEEATTVLGGNYAPVESALLDAGYVVVSMTNTVQNCYGNDQCNADVAAVASLYAGKLSLLAQPYVMADSMGGFTALNAISSGSLHPRAVVGWSINTDLAWDFYDGGASLPITADYDISDTSPYALATLGHDPMLQGGDTFTGIPFALWSSYSDTVVLRSENTDRFATMVNASGGNVQVNTSTGNHLDASNFDPAAVVAFFNAN